MLENPIIKYGRETFIKKAGGKLLESYDVIRQLGKGGFGKVYEVRHKKTGEIRACKHLSKLNINNLEKFKNEIELLRKMDHPNIIKLYEIFESERSLYLIMEECKGGEVFSKIIERINAKLMYSEKDAANIIKQVISCINYCHNKNICHRDLKPENLLYLKDGPEKDNIIKVIDFGLSQNANKLKSKVGTAYYVSPEVLRGNYTEKCDIWSVGVILYLLLTGEPPFNGQNDQIIYSKILKFDLKFPEQKWKYISKEVKDLLQNHMLVPENRRYTAKQVLEHIWFKNAPDTPLNQLGFNVHFFIDYIQASNFKKMSLMFIASRLDENEINNLKNFFTSFDKNKDGQISYEELRLGLLQLKSNKISERDIYFLFQTLDVDKSGKIDYTEFIAATLQRSNYLRNDRLLEAFLNFDKDKNGKITKDELLIALKGEKSQENLIRKFISDVDKNHDGKIDYNEFLNLMQNK